MTTIHEKLVAEYYQALAEGNTTLFLSIQIDDVIYNVNGHSPISGRIVGKKALLEDVLPQVLPKLQMDGFRFATKWKVVCADAARNRIVCIMEADGVGTNGKRYDQRYMHMFEFRSGKISEVWEFFDTALADAVLFTDPSKSKTAGKLASFEF